MVKKSLRWLYRTSITLMAMLLVVIVAAALSIEFFIIPNIDQYKEKIASYASRSTKQKVNIGNIKADWQGIHLHLSLGNVDIFDAGNRPALQLKQVDAAVSWLSIVMLEPHFAEIKIQSPELIIRRTIDGDVFVGGISVKGASKPDLPNWLLRQTKLSLINAKVEWLDEMRQAPSLSLQKLYVEIASPPWRSLSKSHEFTLSASPSVGSESPILIKGKVYGNDVSKLAGWHGEIHLTLAKTNLTAFKPWLDYPIAIDAGTGSMETTVRFEGKALQSVSSNVRLNDLHIGTTRNANVTAENLVLKHLAGGIYWQKMGDTMHLKVEHVSLVTDTNFNLQDINASYRRTELKDADVDESLAINIRQLNLEALQDYISYLPLTEAMQQQMRGLNPSGRLNDVTLRWQGNKAVTKEFSLKSQFTGLTMQAYEQIPGFKNFSGELRADQHSGSLFLNTQSAELNLNAILRKTTPLDHLKGEINWTQTRDSTQIQVDDLHISNPHLSGLINATYNTSNGKPGMLDLKAKFDKADASYGHFYYPTILGETTLHWLDTSVLAGRVEDINVIIKGNLADFPFVDAKNNLDLKKGVFRVTGKLYGGRIEYGTGWPLIEGMNTSLLFEGKRMELSTSAGHLFGNQIIKSKTTIAQLDADSPMLVIDTEVKGPTEEAIKFVNKSPVVEVTQGFTEALKTSGTGKLNLSLKIPMQDLEAARYKGVYQISNASIENDNIPGLTQINGNLEFTENSLNAKNIKAMALGAPLIFNLSSGKDRAIRIAARGKLNDDVIKRSLGKNASYLSGSTDWTGDVLIQKPKLTIRAQTDLYGITSTLPAPLNKTASEHLMLKVIKKQEGANDKLLLNLGNKLQAKIQRNEVNGNLQLDRIAINLNPINIEANNAELNQPKGLQLIGNADYLDLDAWRNVLNTMKENSLNSSSDHPFPEALLSIAKLDLKVVKLDIFGKRLNQLKLSNKVFKDGINLNVQSREISGDLQWLPQNIATQNNGKLVARLTNLTIPDASPNGRDALTEVVNKDFRKVNQDYPALDIIADNFNFNKKDLGRLELMAYPKKEDWVIQKLNFTSPDSLITSEGVWNNWVRAPNCNLNLKWEIKDLGVALKRFGYADTIKGGAGELSGKLSWPGSPKDFDASRLVGNLQIELGKGQILKIQPGVGRLLGLLSLQSLPRRLTLDFRDLFSSGFAFDKINASVKIERGVMRSEDFLMSGPAAEVTIKGETNLQTETQQLLVRVLPNVSDSLSLAALAGGPLAGAVAFLAQKILKDPLNKIASTEYEITGTWDNPQEVKAVISNPPSSKNTPLN